MGILKEIRLAAWQILADLYDLFCLCSAWLFQPANVKGLQALSIVFALCLSLLWFILVLL